MVPILRPNITLAISPRGAEGDIANEGVSRVLGTSGAR